MTPRNLPTDVSLFFHMVSLRDLILFQFSLIPCTYKTIPTKLSLKSRPVLSNSVLNYKYPHWISIGASWLKVQNKSYSLSLIHCSFFFLLIPSSTPTLKPEVQCSSHPQHLIINTDFSNGRERYESRAKKGWNPSPR